MKTIGLIGGMSWESSAQYYRIINRAVQDRLGGVHSAKLLLNSVDFGEIEPLQRAGDWDGQTQRMIDAAHQLERGGAELVLICSNTMHKMADDVAAATPLPLLHIADPTGAALQAAGITRCALLGTAFTMEQGFYRDRLAERFGLEVLIPEPDDRAIVHRVIYEELVRGRIEPASRDLYRAVIARLVDRGAEAVILGCTEIMLLVSAEDSAVPLYDTTERHALAAVEWALW